MTRKTVGYTHLQWTCPNCGHKNQGTAEKCASCQAPQPEDVQFEQPAQEKLIQDEKAVARAKAGADIHCPYCGTRNPANAATCAQCGGDLSEGARRAQGQTVGAHRRQAAPDVACEYCGTMNPADGATCTNCGAALSSPQPRTPSTPSKQASSKGIPAVLIVILVLCCVGAAVVAYLYNRTDEVVGQVEAVEWELRVDIEELGPVSHDDWLDEIPSNADVGVCTEKPHHTQSNPAPGAVEVCGTPYTVDTGTGIGEVVQECEYEVYEDWCEYTVEEWRAVEEASATGNDFNPRWPEPQLSRNQREGNREENYRVVFDTDGSQYTYSTSDFDHFAAFEINSEWVLQVNTFDIVVDVEPAQ
jgi:DNA-directed RNA polymerase subunit RPC12/RpoP